MTRRRIFNWIKILLIVYAFIGIALYYIQDRFLFHPVELSTGHVFHFPGRFTEMSIPVSKTDTISLVRFLPDTGRAKGAVIYYHGNKENVERYARFVSLFTRKGYEVWMPDYPGFGKSRGERNEKKLYSQAWQVYRLVNSAYHSDSIILYGKSFGTGLATYIASGNHCRELILETPYYSIPALFGHYAFIYPAGRMSHYQIPLFQYLRDVEAPVTIFHGTDDGVIPYRQAGRLRELLKAGDRFISIEGGTHHNLAGFPQYLHVMDSLLR